MKTNSVSQLLASVLDIVAPRICPCCGKALCQGERLICAKCLMEMPWYDNNSKNENHFIRQMLPDVVVERAFFLFNYAKNASSSSLIKKIKYAHHNETGRKIGQMMGTRMKALGMLNGVDGVVPVPLHWTRKLQRGYNQSEMIADGISLAGGVPVLPHLAKRVRRTSTQTQKTHSERRENLQGAFKAKPAPQRHLLVVDDVLTTGSTLKQLILAIREQNPDMKFSIAAVARTPIADF